MSLNDGFNDFYNEFKDWTKKQILHRTYDICLENADKDREIDKLTVESTEWESKFYDLQEENQRLNNIINELEEWCLSWKENDKYCYLASNDKDKCRYDIWEEVLDKLKELKEENK